MAAAAGGRGSGSADGDVPAATRQQAYAWCREFLAGSWKLISPDEFGIWPIGLVSHTVAPIWGSHFRGSLIGVPRCGPNLGFPFSGIPDWCPTLCPVLGRPWPPPQGLDSLVLESVMFAILAERALGPRLFGVFPQGRLEQYLPSRRLRTEELREPRVSAEIAVNMARFHGMAMPFNKEPKWLFGTMEGYLQQISELTFSEPEQLQQLEQLRGYNLEQEMRSLRDLLEATPSPVVFCHNDVQEGNPQGCPFGVPAPVPAPPHPQLHSIRHYLCKGSGVPWGQGASLGSSGPLGSGVGPFGCPEVSLGAGGVPGVSLWGPVPVPSSIPSGTTCPSARGPLGPGRFFGVGEGFEVEGSPGVSLGAGGVPGLSLWGPWAVPLGSCARPQLHSIRHYPLSTWRVPGRAPQEEQARLEEQMLREIERFTLASHFFWGLWSVVQAKISTIHFGYLDYAQSRFQAYFQHKARCS
ncbi:choline/ethanolamine kinase [Passer montanus]|nr:choline/ethanolamine kinase [Passer montanus]